MHINTHILNAINSLVTPVYLCFTWLRPGIVSVGAHSAGQCSVCTTHRNKAQHSSTNVSLCRLTLYDLPADNIIHRSFPLIHMYVYRRECAVGACVRASTKHARHSVIARTVDCTLTRISAYNLARRHQNTDGIGNYCKTCNLLSNRMQQLFSLLLRYTHRRAQANLQTKSKDLDDEPHHGDVIIIKTFITTHAHKRYTSFA